MSPTLFGFLWVPLNLSCCLQPARLLQLAIVSSIFQGAAIAIQGEGYSGFAIVPSLLTATLYIVSSFLQRLTGRPTPSDRCVFELLLPLLLFVAYAVLSAYFIPRLFEGHVEVWPQRVDPLTLNAASLTPSRGNLTQSVYLVLNIGLVALATLHLFPRPQLQIKLVRSYITSGYVVLAICLWDFAAKVAGIPYPYDFLYSNKSLAVYTGQIMAGVTRVSGPFTEPSYLALFLSGTLFSSTFLILGGHRERSISWLGVCSLLMILLSTSTTGLICVFIVLPAILLMRFVRSPGLGLRRIGVALGITIVVSLAFVAPLPSIAPDVWRSIQGVAEATMEKPRSESFEVRSRQDTDSLGLLRSTYGLGAGWGSVRASSLIPTLVGNVGIPGMLLLSWLAVCVTLRVGRARRQQLTPQRRFVLDASSGSLLGTLLAAIIAVPDLEPLSFYVLLAALIACLAGIAREHRAARRPFYPGRLTSNPVPTPPRPVGGR